MVYRDIALAELTGGRLHILHVSTAGSVELIRRGKAARRPRHRRGVPAPLHADRRVPAHLRQQLQDDPAAAHRGRRAGGDRRAEGRHARRHRHRPRAARAGEEDARAGPGARTASSAWRRCCRCASTALIEPGHLTWPQLIEKLTVNPRPRARHRPRHAASRAPIADVTIIDPDAEWTIDPSKFRSKSRNSPLRRLEGPRPGRRGHRRRHGARGRLRAHPVLCRGDVEPAWNCGL